MKTQTILFALSLILSLITSVHAQSVEEETGFKYVKGNYLFDSGRFDEAIQIYNDIVKGDPAFEEVLIYRARAKYALGAYKGAKKDGLAYIEFHGLNEEVCLILGQAELQLGNPLIAISYLDYSIMKNPANSEALLFRGNAYFEIEDDVAACTDWHKAKRLGSDRASQNTSTYCSRVAIPIEDEPVKKPEVVAEDDGEELGEDEEVISAGSREEEDDNILSGDEVLSTEDMDEQDDMNDSAGDEMTSASEDDYIYENSDDDLDSQFPDEDPVFGEPLDIVVEIIEIDEDLDIKLYDGIGSREVREVPDILILSDKAGQVVVNVCVDESGNVSSATLNKKKSTVGSAGLISLALRKSREFKFSRTRNGEQCGKIAFLIKN
ncbi:tetratricopeptide repeat protein [Portibacter marinus]|uniref:tetratricopeptide repeat protein n=1 Tax=Portibacter marinus TaxID=2898660 RepID=UPI001F40AFC1|nr:tetratricopeptide repeat protein [Portibacter marinus]